MKRDFPSARILFTKTNNPVVTGAENQLINDASGLTLWDISNPQLYIVQTTLYRDDREIDTREDIIGIRETEFRSDGFYLNGKKIKIRGLNRHQSYPYV